METKYGRIKVELTIDFKEYITETERDKFIADIEAEVYHINSNIADIEIKDVNHLTGLTIREGMGNWFIRVPRMGGWSDEISIPKWNFKPVKPVLQPNLPKYLTELSVIIVGMNITFQSRSLNMSRLTT